MKVYEVAFIGDRGVGKTTAIDVLKGIWHPSKAYVSTMGYEANPIDIKTERGLLRLTIHDYGHQWLKTHDIDRPVDVTCVFYDTTCVKSFEIAMEVWMRRGKGLVVPVGTKADHPNHKFYLPEFAELRTTFPAQVIVPTNESVETMLRNVIGALEA